MERIHREGEFQVETRHDWKTMERAEEVAACFYALTGDVWVATDAGPGVWPRYDVAKAPRVGDVASRTFNGDYYPCGTVASVSESLRVVRTTSGHTFYRRGRSGAWVSGGTWGLVAGHHDERNPSF